MPKLDELSLPQRVRNAFCHRSRPIVISTSKELSKWEEADLKFIARFESEEVTADLWEKHFDTWSLFSPEAFCYYLPGICITSYIENQPDLIVVSNIIGTLDRTPNSDWWDEQFLERWPLLTVSECKAVQDWIWWLTTCSPSSHSEDSLMRALHTVELLINKRLIE